MKEGTIHGFHFVNTARVHKSVNIYNRKVNRNVFIELFERLPNLWGRETNFWYFRLKDQTIIFKQFFFLNYFENVPFIVTDYAELFEHDSRVQRHKAKPPTKHLSITAAAIEALYFKVQFNYSVKFVERQACTARYAYI